MQKKKIFDIADSNIELLGSKVDKDCRKAAAGGEKAWAVAGKKPGLQIWRIENFKVVKTPKQDYGKFYEGDSYILLNTYEKKDTDALAWDVHFWLGPQTSQDEAGTAAYKTVELDDYLGGAPIQHREIGNYESGLFLSYFAKNGGIQILSGGVDSGFNKVEPESYEPRLIHLKGRKNIRCTQVELKMSSLCAGDCFILDAGLTIYQWHGKASNMKEKTRAAQYARNLDTERSGRPEVIVIDQGDKDVPPEFFEILGSDDVSKIRADDGGDAAWEKKSEKMMFQLSDASGTLEFVSVGQGKTVTAAKLDTNDVFIIDTGSEIYVWVGKGASDGEKATSMSKAQQYLRDYKKNLKTPITRVIEGAENELFNCLMQPKQKRKLKKSTGGPTVEQKGEMGCYLTSEPTSNGSLYLNWSQESVEGHLAYFAPTKSVPKFKFKTKGGKSELTRETNSQKKVMFEAWCNFFKLAKEFKSTFIYKTSDVSLYSLIGTKITELERGVQMDISKVEVIAACPGAKPLFKGIKSIDRGAFLNKAQERGGALVLPAVK